MTTFRFIIKSFLHYTGNNLTVIAGVAVATAVITGALILGDSVRYSLEKTAHQRLGNTTFVITAGDRYFTSGLANLLQDELGVPCIPLLQTEGIAVTEGGARRVNNIKVTGVDNRFNNILTNNFDFGLLSDNKVFISKNLAAVLGLEENDLFLLRIRKTSIIPLNAPFVTDQEITVSARVTVGAILNADEMGQFNLRNSQTAPFNIFINLDFLNHLMETEGKSNTMLITSSGDTQKEENIHASLKKVWNPEDASLKIRHIPETNELELLSERIFLEPEIHDVFAKAPADKRNILTYFVNALKKDNLETPYSFVSTLEEHELQGNEIIVNEWLAKDLNIRAGDSIEMVYFTVGPLRKLVEESARFRVKGIAPMTGKYNDASLMPFIPGLSDAGSCRDWEAGIPIDLSKIRVKDEDYWNKWKGTPKAFIRYSNQV